MGGGKGAGGGTPSSLVARACVARGEGGAGGGVHVADHTLLNEQEREEGDGGGRTLRPTHDAAAVAVGHPRVSVRGAAGPAAPRPDPTPPPLPFASHPLCHADVGGRPTSGRTAAVATVGPSVEGTKGGGSPLAVPLSRHVPRAATPLDFTPCPATIHRAHSNLGRGEGDGVTPVLCPPACACGGVVVGCGEGMEWAG